MIRVFIIEDESYIRKGLKVQLKSLKKEIEIVGESPSIKNALDKVDKLKPNLILLDIKLIDGTGFDFLKQTKYKNFKVIFITSYDNYAIKALKAGAIDYILKPIEIDELEDAINKIERILLKSNNKKLTNIITLNFIKGSQIIDLDELMFCKSHRGYTTFYLANKKEFLSSKPLKEYEKKLINNKFIRTHQSYFVNLSFVLKVDFTKRILLLKGGNEVPIAARKIAEIKKYFNN